MKLEQTRPGVFTATMTANELSVLLAGARMSLSVMQAGTGAGSEQAKAALETVLTDLDRSLARLHRVNEQG